MEQTGDLFAQGEFEHLSDVITSNLEPEQILALLAQRISQVLTVMRVSIALRQGKALVSAASYPATGERIGSDHLDAAMGIEEWVARHGRPLVLEEGRMQHGPAAARALADPGLLGMNLAAVPIWSGRQVIGVLTIIDEPAVFESRSTAAPVQTSAGVATEVAVSSSLHSLIPLLLVLADLISLALDNRRLMVQEDRRVQLLNLLAYLAAHPAQQHLPDVAQAVAEKLTAILQAPVVNILLHSADTDELLAVGISETPLGRLQRELGLDHLPLGAAGVIAQVFLTGQPFFSDRLDEAAQFPADLRAKLELKAAAVVPIEAGIEAAEQRRGILLLASANPETFAQEDMLFLRLISTRLGVLLQQQAWSRELAQVEAERLARMEREDFLSVVAHDLKNALTTMRGNAQLALRRAARGGGEPASGVLKRIADRANQAIQMVNDLVDVNHLETGAFRLYLEPVELVEFLREEVAAFQAAFDSHFVFTFQSDFEQMTIEADRNRLSQVLANLVTNAVRYSPQGGTIELLLTHPPAADHPAFLAQHAASSTLPQSMLLVVNDEGIGVAPGEREHIFERTVRGRGAKLAPGSGLGLYISREIIKRHGGHIWVEGRDGQGASFRFTLPASRTHTEGSDN